MVQMNRIKLGKSSLVIALSVLLGQLAWPGISSLPVLLGPTILLGIEPLVPLSGWQYLAAALANALVGMLTGGYWLAGLIVLQFSLWYWAHKRQQNWTWVVSVSLPLGLLLWLHSAADYRIYLLSLGSALVQLLLYHTLTSVSQQKLKQLQEKHYYRQGADRLLAATAQSRQLELLNPIVHALNATMEQTYDTYQDLEMLARVDPNLPQPLAARLLTSAQLIHRNRLQLQEWRGAQEQILQEFVGREVVSLRTACSWVTTHIADTTGRVGHHVETTIDLSEDTLLTQSEQLPLTSLLLYVCQQGLAQLTSTETNLRINGYVAGEGMRIVVALAPKSDQPSGEWPELTHCDLSPVSDHAERLNAICRSGVTSQGEHVYTLELH